MSIAGVDYRHVFGMKSDAHATVSYQDEQTLIYPAGQNLIFYNQETKQQRFLHLGEKSEGLFGLSLSTSKKWLCVAEIGKFPSCLIYDLSVFRKRKSLSLPDVESKDFISMSFSSDSKYLVTLTSGPDWLLHYWSWEKSKILASIRCTIQPDRANPSFFRDTAKDPLVGQVVYQCLFNPSDNTQVSAVGNGICRIYKLSDGSLKLIANPKIDQRNVLTHSWTGDDRIICGTEDGKVYVFESNGEQKFEFTNIPSTSKVQRPVNIIVAFSKGILFGGGCGNVTLLEKEEMGPGAGIAKDSYRKTKEFNLADEGSAILILAISPTEESFLCSTEKNQMYSASLSNGDSKQEGIKLEPFGQPFHHGAILGMDTCVRKPLVVTCATDKSVRVWNYSDETSELVKYFPEESFCVSIHPSGLYILVGFTDKLKLMNLLIDDIRPFREFSLRGCKEVKFSNGGQYFAAVTANTVQIYSTWNFDTLGTLKGHNGKVKSIYWTADDSRIVTSGSEGAVYEWNLKDMSGHAGQGIRRDYENILKTCNYSCAAMAADGKSIYAVGSDKTLKEIVEGTITKEIPVDVLYTQICLSTSGKMMFAGTSTGSIRAIKYPFGSDAGIFQEHLAHAGPVTKLCVSFDDQYLFSVSEDGCFFIFRIYDKENKVAIKKERELIYADEILVTKSDLEEKNAMMAELKTRVEELKMENEYQLRLKDMNFNEKIKQVTEKFLQEIETLKITATVLRTDKEKEDLRHQEEMQEEKERHEKDLGDMENSQNQKLMVEYEKVTELQAKTSELHDQWDSQMKAMQDAKNKALEDLNRHFEERLLEKQQEMDKLQEEIRKQVQEYEETTKETEYDADSEIQELRHRYEKKLNDEREIVMRLKGENGIMRKKFNSLQGEIEVHKGEISKMYNEEKKLHSVIKSLEKDIAGLKKEIHERDETIQDKEKRIYDLKKKNQELEKFKFVLDYKIKELKKQIEPRENDIQSMTSQIKDMNVELEGYHKCTSELDLAIADLRLKLNAAENEVIKERIQVSKGVSFVKNFKNDLYGTVQNVQDPKALKRSLKKLYQKYCGGTTETESADQDAELEYERQREYLERTIETLRRKALKDQKAHRAENVRIMQENVVLISEINYLRKGVSKKETALPKLKQTGAVEKICKTDFI